MPWYVHAPLKQVPNVAGLSQDRAIALLNKSDLEGIVSDTTYDDLIPSGNIVLQKPEAGETVKSGRKVYLVISGGDPIVQVPQLEGKSLTDATFILERVGLQVGDVEKIPSRKPNNVIVGQEFPVGTKLRKGATVDLSISMGGGAGSIVVPYLVGKSLADAKTILSENKLSVGRINYQPSDELLPNTVLDQYPSSGSKLEEGDEVHLFVAEIPAENDGGQ